MIRDKSLRVNTQDDEEEDHRESIMNVFKKQADKRENYTPYFKEGWMDITVIKWNAVEQYIIQVLFRRRRSFTGVYDGPGLLQDTQHCYIWKTLSANSQTMQLCVPVQGMWLTVFPGVSQLWVVRGTSHIRSAPWVFSSAWMFGPLFSAQVWNFWHQKLELCFTVTGLHAQIKRSRYTLLGKKGSSSVLWRVNGS